MANPWDDAVDFGVVHALAFLECRAGEGPVAATLRELIAIRRSGASNVCYQLPQPKIARVLLAGRRGPKPRRTSLAWGCSGRKRRCRRRPSVVSLILREEASQFLVHPNSPRLMPITRHQLSLSRTPGAFIFRLPDTTVLARHMINTI